MSCILYKDGKKEVVNAVDVAYLLTQGYTAEPVEEPAKEAPKRGRKRKDDKNEG